MAKNVLILSTSPRKKGNSAALAEAFAEGAREAGNRAEVVSLCGMKLEFCRGCLACQKTGRCIIDDDVLARLLSFNNVIVTSHQAFFTHEALENIAMTTLQNIRDFINHKPLLNEVKK